MKSYQTQQKKDLLDFLRANSQSPLSIEDIATGLNGTIGKSTVYRLMNKLVEEETVTRFVQGNSRQFLYQLKDREDCHTHLHCRCTGCGRLYHLDHKASGTMAQLLAQGGFALDTGKTTLLGTCQGCLEKEIS